MKKFRIVIFTISSIILMNVPTLYSNALSDLQLNIKNQIDREILDQSNRLPGQAVVLIYSDTSWSGSILDSSFDSATRDGSGDSKIFIQCSNNGIYSLSIQKQTDYGYLLVTVIQDGSILDSQSTTAQYGIVSLAGNC